MRFKRADLPGIAIAMLAPVAMYLLFLDAFDLWQHRGTPLLSVLAMMFGLGAGVIAGVTRFVRHWRIVGGLAALLLVDVAGVLTVQHTGHDWTLLAAALKLAGVALFVAVNAVIAYDLVDRGLLPILDRRAARRAATSE